MQLKSIVAANVRQYRKINNMTQAELADRLNMTTDMVGKIERGYSSPSFVTIELLSRVFDIPPAALFSGDTATVVNSERALLLNQINEKLSKMTETDLKRTLGVIDAIQ
ncbi:helix-turn-helix domain-containing protein [Kordiimonas sp. SCSIO 12610]|uniref:helix-turn-helix domain-containing protein n=1 Tax=Kordiimonas sp. SCSIO 12610 TaxID=2829597 RepID=UPI002108AF4B|nr:helix-turn-helix transcriptional regulator [Kordiimonas sp. SCSIO 12610]UTW54612.1 helix-turn-helix transcriptional regulator [Kordiimonas sp. SCSIO 12610]